MQKVFLRMGILALSFLTCLPQVLADPCGMVPPVYTSSIPGKPPPRPRQLIRRVGPQKTYVFYRKGIESIVLRPGFSGKVDNFGMLIPFPSPPSIRKVPDNIFSHITKAINPPIIPVYAYQPKVPSIASTASEAPAKKTLDDGLAVLKKNKVRVLKREAIGMYQVAVLQAGSPKALKIWMKKHGYQYPKGMDQVTLEYIKAGWCFVAVKTRVAGKYSVKARPGMRKARPSFPRGGSFNGHVQAMGFRFRTRKLVVPMRLSAFNGGRLRNVVYLLTSGPKAIRHIPKKYVRRQISGRDLHRNVTKLLPMRVYGSIKRLSSYRWPWIQRRRNPEPHNGHAKNLFASDLLSVRKNKLSHKFEEKKKVFLRIGERLLLRGHVLDGLHREVLKGALADAVGNSLNLLKSMTMTVIDGDFPRKVLARENLTFAYYKMPRKKNKDQYYNAQYLRGYRPYGRARLTYWQGPKRYRPKKKKPLKLKSKRRKNVPSRAIYNLIRQMGSASKANRAVRLLVGMGQQTTPYLLGEALESNVWERRGWSIVALSELRGDNIAKGLVKLYKDKKQPMLVRTWGAAARILLTKSAQELVKYRGLMNQFRATHRTFKKRFQYYFQQQKNWSIKELNRMLWLALSYKETRGPFVHTYLQKMLQKPNLQFHHYRNILYRTRYYRGCRAHFVPFFKKVLKRTKKNRLNLLIQFYNVLSGYRYHQWKLQKILQKEIDKKKYTFVQLLNQSTRYWSLRPFLVQKILKYPPQKLAKVLVSPKANSNIRRAAAGYLGNIARTKPRLVAFAVIQAYKFRKGAKSVPWDRGALFLPYLKWPRDQARELVSELLTWMVWCEFKKQHNQRRQIHNNLRSLQLARMAGYRSPGWRLVSTQYWLQLWKRSATCTGVNKILKKNAHTNYSSVYVISKQMGCSL